ncbi:MAG: hypothetical protein WCS52_12710 [bacterium]
MSAFVCAVQTAARGDIAGVVLCFGLVGMFGSFEVGYDGVRLPSAKTNVRLAYAENPVEVERVRFDITDDGFTRCDENGPFPARVAIRWRDLASSHDHLTSRLLGNA